MAQLGVTTTCVCGKSVDGVPAADGTVTCGACGRRVVLDPTAAARAFGTADATKSIADDLHDSTGKPFVIKLEAEGVTQSVVAGEKTGIRGGGHGGPVGAAPHASSVTGALGPKLPDKLACYRVLGRLGEGGMGVVYKGHDETLDRPVALKVLARTRGSEGAHAELEREARSIAAITHPHVVQVYAAGEQDGLAYFAMELVHGPDLRDVLEREGPLSVARARRYMEQAAQGLRAAARKGIFHRDVKPANLLLDSREDQIKVADFGLAKRACVDASMGGTSLIAGTPLYVAPEVIKEGSGDHRSDIYSLGSAFFHLLSGQPPFGGKTAADALVGHATAPAPDLHVVRPDVPVELAALIRRCMEKDPAARFQTYDQLLVELGAKPMSTSGTVPALVVAPRPAAPVASAAVAPPAPPRPPVPPVPPVPPARATFETASRPLSVARPEKPNRWPLVVAVVAVVAGANGMLGLAAKPRLTTTSRAKRAPAEPLADCGFAAVVRDLQRSAVVPGQALLPVDGSVLRPRVDRCPSSRLPVAVCGKGGPLLAWHVHDVKRRIVSVADADGTIGSWSLYDFLHYLRALAADAEHGRGKSWSKVVDSIRPFLPPDGAQAELDRLDEDD